MGTLIAFILGIAVAILYATSIIHWKPEVAKNHKILSFLASVYDEYETPIKIFVLGVIAIAICSFIVGMAAGFITVGFRVIAG